MSTSIESLPTETLLKIVERVAFPKDIRKLEVVSKKFRAIITSNWKSLARTPCSASISLEENSIHICTNNSDVIMKTSLNNMENVTSKIAPFEISSLTLIGRFSKNLAATHNIGNDVKIISDILRILRVTRQFRITAFVIKNVKIEDKDLCQNFIDLIGQKYCKQIVLENCVLANGFNQSNINKLENICQFTENNCTFIEESTSCADLFLAKFTHDLRFKPKRNMPFYILASKISQHEICKFLQNWLYISEANFFEIRVKNCNPSYQENFINECESNRLSQIHLEFPSLAHPTAHVKAKYNQSENVFELFPVLDVPARVYGQTICYTRHFRDF